jgi:hypothetical protein
VSEQGGTATTVAMPREGLSAHDAAGEEPRFEIDLTDPNNRTAIRDAMVTELTRQVRALSQGLVAEIVRPALREHRLRATGRVD